MEQKRDQRYFQKNGEGNDNVVDKIRKLRSLAELKPEEFAKETGLADSVAQREKGEMEFTQIRKFFSEVKRIETKMRDKGEGERVDKSDLSLLIPVLVYGVGRDVISKGFYEVMKICIDKIETKKDFKRFVEFLTAIVAYAKYHKEVKK